MRIVGKHLLQKFSIRHPASRTWISSWVKEVEEAKWSGPQEVKDRYSSVSFISGNSLVFNVKGNSFRLEVKVSFKLGLVSVSRIGTHAEYDRWTE